MIRVSVLYPAGDDITFDMDYYLSSHIPMVRQALGDVLLGVTVDQGVAGGVPGQPPTYAVVTQLTASSLDAFNAAFAPSIGDVMADIPKFTNANPTLQFSDVKL